MMREAPTGPPRRRARWWCTVAAATIAVSGVAGTRNAAAAPPPAAAVRPILVIGGHFTTDYLMSGMPAALGANPSGGAPVETMQLRNCTKSVLPGQQPLIFPCDTLPPAIKPYYDHPGTASNIDSAIQLSRRVDALLAGKPAGTKVDLVAISQGILAARAYVNLIGGAASKVANVVSWFGVNKGIKPAGFLASFCPETGAIQVCKEMVYPKGEPGNPTQYQGQTPFLLGLNSPDMTGGDGIGYYHIYTRNPADPDEMVLLERGPSGLEPVNKAVQEICDVSVTHGTIANPTMQAMVRAALGQNPMPTACV